MYNKNILEHFIITYLLETGDIMYTAEHSGGNLIDVMTQASTRSKTGKTKTNSTQKGKLSTKEARREYQRQYYQRNKEKAKEYQRRYNLTHKKKSRGTKSTSKTTAPREVIRTTFNTSDLMHSPVEKTLKMLQKIIRGERLFTM